MKLSPDVLTQPQKLSEISPIVSGRFQFTPEKQPTFTKEIEATSRWGNTRPLMSRATQLQQYMFPAATGMEGEPRYSRVETYQGGPAGTATAFGVRRGWTFGE